MTMPPEFLYKKDDLALAVGRTHKKHTNIVNKREN